MQWVQTITAPPPPVNNAQTLMNQRMLNHRTMQTAALGLLILIAAAADRLAGPAYGYPEPEIVTKAWELDFTHGEPQPIAINDLEGKTRWYWYMTYKVENNTGEDRLFVPDITVFTDSGQIIPAAGAVPGSVFTAIKQREANPLLMHPALVVDLLRQGPDHARESVAVWPALEDDVDRISLFFSGISGETQEIVHAVSGERVLLRKTLMLGYDTPGTTRMIQDQPVILNTSQWIMR